jgi:hypothetical protein
MLYADLFSRPHDLVSGTRRFVLVFRLARMERAAAAAALGAVAITHMASAAE